MLFLFFIAGGQFVFAQRPDKIDSLNALLKKDKNDSNKVNHLIEICREYRISCNYDTASHYTQVALQLAQKIGFKKGLADSYSNLGIINHEQSNYNEALTNHFTALKIRKEIGDNKEIANSYNNIGLIYMMQGNYPEALKNHFVALKIMEEINDSGAIASSYNNIGIIYVRQGNYTESLKNYFAALKIKIELGDKRGIATYYNNIGTIYDRQGNYTEAMKFHFASLKIREEINDKKGIATCYNNIGVIYSIQRNYTEALKNHLSSLKIKEQIGDKDGSAMSYNNIGDVFYKQNNYHKALENYFKGLTIYDGIGDKDGIASSYNNIGNVYGRTNNYTESISWLHKGLKLAKMIGTKDLMMDAYNGLSNTYSRMKDYKNAHENYLLYSAVKDTLFNEEKSKQQAEMEAQYENEKKEKEILGLQKDNEIKQLALNKNRAQFFALAAGVGIILLIGFLVFQRNRQKHKQSLHAEMLLHQEERLRTIIETQEEERKRISKDLHDGVGQLLTGLKLAWQNVSGEISSAQPLLKEKITSSTKVLDEAATEVRSISHQMMPRALQESGMVTAIESMLSKSLSNTGINYEFEHSNIERFTESIEINLYRVTQEMINNILKHAGADQINVQLYKNNNNLVLIIEDNGKGFNFDKQKKEGHGLMNITTRVKSLRGEIHYEPGPEKGTVATVRIPLA